MDYWLSGLLASFINVNRKKGTPAVTAKSIRPAWSWEDHATVEEKTSMEAATSQLLSFVSAMAEASRKAREANPPKSKKKPKG